MVRFRFEVAGVVGFVYMSDSEYISFGGVLALRKPNEYRSNMIAYAISVHSTRLPPQPKQKERFRSSFLLAGVVGFEPTKWKSQSLLPYRLATPQYFDVFIFDF